VRHAPSDGKARVLQAVEIVELIGKSVKLTRRGKDYVGLCPFHQEKTPSFHVSPARQFFYCYGCKAGGNAIDFVMRRDRLGFVEAMKHLADELNIQLPDQVGQTQDKSERQALLDAHSAACAFFEKSLSHPHIGAAARGYLESRGFTQASVQQFRIGLAPDGWDNLLRSEPMRKFSPEVLQLAGLVKPRGNGEGHYDTFRHRLMFPIRDEVGRIIAFGGRVMPGSDDPAKYLNSPETPLFHKSRAVFGLDLARQRIVETRTVAVVEGYTDVIMAHQYGASNVVSILGTALTEQHVNILRRFADRIVLLFDADTAGESAVNRAVELFLTHPVEIAIATIPEDLDPDEYLLKHGADAFSRLLEQAQDALMFVWQRLSRQFRSEDDLTGQQKAVGQYLELLAAARGSGPVDTLRWGSALGRVSRLTGIPSEELHRRFGRSRRSAAQTPQVSSPGKSKSDLPQAPRRVLTAQDHAERRILGLLLAEPGRWQHVQREIGLDDFSDPERRRLAEIYWDHQRDEGEPVFNEFLGVLGESDHAPPANPGQASEGPGTMPDGNEPSMDSRTKLVSLAVELLEEAQALPEADKTLEDAIAYLRQARHRHDGRKLVAALRRTNAGAAPSMESAIDEVEVLRRLQEQARKPDLRRF
jgi:DNA primase